MTVLLAQITDTHIREPGRLAYGRVDTGALLRSSVDALLALPQRPDAVVVTGDLVDFGRPAEYRHLRALLAPLPMPVYLLPGNHDDRDALREAFADHAYLEPGAARGDGGAFVQYTATIGALRLVALDTVALRQSHGELCKARLDWLESTLAGLRGEPVVVAMHHPPFATLIGHMDRIGLLTGIERLAAIVASHPNVERVICGHLHRAIDVRFAGTIASTGPSTAHQVCLDLAEDAASAFRMEPPGFRLHAWTAQTGVVTHLVASGRHDGPHPFHEPDGALIG